MYTKTFFFMDGDRLKIERVINTRFATGDIWVVQTESTTYRVPIKNVKFETTVLEGE